MTKVQGGKKPIPAAKNQNSQKTKRKITLKEGETSYASAEMENVKQRLGGRRERSKQLHRVLNGG